MGVALVAAAYYVASRLGLELAYLDGAVTAVWPPAGLGLAALFLYGIRLWPGIVIGDLLLAHFSTPIGTVLGQTVGNTLALVVAALLLRRLTAGRGGLVRTVDVLAFVACAVAAATVSVSNDGVGGADPNVGSGLRGLAARVEALDGRLHVDSPPQRGTRIKRRPRFT